MARSRPGGPPVTSRSVEGLLADPRDDDEDSATLLPPSHRPAPEPLPEEERPFGRYTLLRRLAYGGMGEVFLARQGGAGSLATVAKLVVIKRILQHMKRDEKHRQMFLGEARLQALLNSPHIVAIHDMGEERGHVYLAMEHVHGPSWRLVVDRCRMRKEHVPLAHVCAMVAQAARGLSYAHNLVDVTGHALKIVHRDINPHNILVTYDGQVKIIDFGIAKSELHDGQTETGTIKGKFNYMSPEQSAAEPLDARSDLFALGICLYELATNVNPFRRGNAVLSLEAIQKDAPPPVARRRPEAYPLQPILERCLAKDREDRYADAAEIAADLDELVASGAIPAPREPLSTWLRERFADEIAEHVQILEQTGSQSAAAVRSGSDPSQMPRPARTNTSHPRARPETKPPPSDDAVELLPVLDVPLSLEQTSTTPAPTSQPAAEPRPAEKSSSSARMARQAPAPAERQTGGAALGAAVGVLLLAAIGLAVFVGYRVLIENVETTTSEVAGTDETREPAGEARGEPGGEPREPREPAEPSKANDVPQGDAAGPTTTTTTEPPAQKPGAAPEALAQKDGPEKEEAPERRDDEAVDTTADPPAVAPGNRTRTRNNSKTEKPVVVEKEIFATLGVRTDGYAVRGPRKLPKGETIALSIGGDGAPFSVKLRVQQVGEGARVSVVSDPWALLIIDGVGKGKTPQSFSLLRGASAMLKLSSPKASAPMEIGLSLQ